MARTAFAQRAFGSGALSCVSAELNRMTRGVWEGWGCKRTNPGSRWGSYKEWVWGWMTAHVAWTVAVCTLIHNSGKKIKIQQ